MTMGLDMYLKAEKYVSNYDHETGGRGDVYQMLVKELGVEDFVSKDTPSATLSFTVGYWRKANHIHRWFVENCQDGVDECQLAWVGREKLEELRTTCQEVLKGIEMEKGQVVSHFTINDGKRVDHTVEGQVVVDASVAEELLPTQEGFFFGGTQYDEWYVDDLKNTVEIIDKVLKMPQDWDFYYRSSW